MLKKPFATCAENETVCLNLDDTILWQGEPGERGPPGIAGSSIRGPAGPKVIIWCVFAGDQRLENV